MFTWMLHHKYR